jgi:hypothetical protein
MFLLCVEWRITIWIKSQISHKFQIWKHDSLIKFGFINSTSSQHVIFDNSYKLHQILYEPTTNNLWLPLVTFFKWSLVVWRPHQHVHKHVKQFVVLLDSTCTCYGSPCQMTSWFNCPWNILHPHFQPISHLRACLSNML